MHPQQSPHDTLARPVTRAPRRWLVTFLSLALLLLAMMGSATLVPEVAAQSAAATATAGEQTAADVAAEVRNSAVTVYTYSNAARQYSPGQTGQEPTGAGSGWVYSNDGIVVTNAHVVSGADEVKVVTADGTIIPAEVVGTDWYRDVAVLRLKPEHGQKLPPAATVGDSDAIRAGDEVVAIGTPLGLFAITVTVGYVGAVDRSLNTGVGYSLNHLIQHDASLSPGNSGGPLFSMDGKVIGMNVAKLDALTTGQPNAADMGFAIDSNTVVAAVKEILANGSVAYPYLGVQAQLTTDGVTIVTGVEAGSPAAAAGVQPGDAIVAVDGTRVDATHGFIDLLYRHKAGDTVTLTVDRDGSEVAVKVTLAERPAGL
jgi:S1-C subfamily serine protease